MLAFAEAGTHFTIDLVRMESPVNFGRKKVAQMFNAPDSWGLKAESYYYTNHAAI